MDRARAPIYVFDPWLDDSVEWWAQEIVCPHCGHHFGAVYRADKYPVCPRCVITDRIRVSKK